MALFKQEKSSKSVLILQTVSTVLYLLSLVLAITAAGLFGEAQSSIKSDLGMEYCVLFFKEDNPVPSTSTCRYSIAGEVLAGVGLCALIILSILKMAAGFMRNNILLVVDILLLIVTGIFAVTAAIVICAGWGVACDTVNDFSKTTGVDITCNRDYYKNITGAAACSGISCIIITVSIVMYIITAVTTRRE